MVSVAKVFILTGHRTLLYSSSYAKKNLAQDWFILFIIPEIDGVFGRL